MDIGKEKHTKRWSEEIAEFANLRLGELKAERALLVDGIASREKRLKELDAEVAEVEGTFITFAEKVQPAPKAKKKKKVKATVAKAETGTTMPPMPAPPPDDFTFEPQILQALLNEPELYTEKTTNIIALLKPKMKRTSCQTYATVYQRKLLHEGAFVIYGKTGRRTLLVRVVGSGSACKPQGATASTVSPSSDEAGDLGKLWDEQE